MIKMLPKELDRFTIIESGCWIWNGHIDKDGYGKVKYKSKMEQAHRVIYEVINNVILEISIHVHHDKCKTKACVNPEHMKELGKQEHNFHKQKIKLDSDLGREIIQLYVFNNLSATRIGKKYNISCTTIMTF